MIPIYKLDKLPRAQKLRKIAKYFSMAEKRLNKFLATNKNIETAVNIFTISELEFFAESAKLLAKDELFPTEARKFFEQARDVFETAMLSNNNTAHCSLLTAHCSNNNPSPQTLVPSPFIRSLNGIKHILLAATGNEMSDWDFTTANGSLDPKKRQVFKGMQVYLEDIRSPFNVGAMFRTAESFGVEKIILSPFTADPRHRRAERTAMGCVDIVQWEKQELFAPAGSAVIELPYPVFALETGGIPINEFKFPVCGILIAGSEELGVSPRALEAADASLGRVSIPIYGAKASLNVSTAFGIALQAWSYYLRNF